MSWSCGYRGTWSCCTSSSSSRYTTTTTTTSSSSSSVVLKRTGTRVTNTLYRRDVGEVLCCGLKNRDDDMHQSVGHEVPTYVVMSRTDVVVPLLLASVTSVASMVTVLVLFVRPVLRSIEDAAEQAEITSKDLEKAAEEMERTALMFQNDLPLTMKEVQKASEEFELVGKQLNVIVSSVARPLTIERPVEKAAESISKVAGTSTARFSRRIVHETTSVANNLWSSINQVARQLGLRGVTDEAVEEAKRLVYIGRQQQEARTWIERWRWRTAMRESGREDEEVQQLSQNSAPYNDVGYSPVVDQEEVISRAVEALERSPGEYILGGDDDPVSEVFNALARAQAAAEEAAVSSSALEKALQKAEESGMLSSSDEDDLY